jgi:Sec-independent protein translocase protein TatA
MFDLSLAEVLLIFLVSIFLIKPEELPGILRTIKDLKQKAFGLKKEFSDSIQQLDGVNGITKEFQTLHQEVKTIIDLDGNPQRAYDIEDIKKELQQTTSIKNLAEPSDKPKTKN